MPQLIPFIPLISSGVGLVSGLFGGNQAQQRNNQIDAKMNELYGKQQGAMDAASGLVPTMTGLIDQQGNVAKGYTDLSGALGGLLGQYGGPGGMMDQLSQLYTQAQGLKPVGANDNGAGGMLMGNAHGVLNATDPGVYRRQAQLAGEDALGQISADAAARGIGGSGASGRTAAQTLSRLYADGAARGQQDRLQAYGLSNSAAGAAGNLGLQQSQMLAGQQNDHMGLLSNLLGMRGTMVGQQAGLIGQQGNLLGNLLTALGGMNGQYGNIANLYQNQAAMYGNAAAQQGNNLNPNPYGGVGAALGGLGQAGGQLANYFDPRFAIPKKA